MKNFTKEVLFSKDAILGRVKGLAEDIRRDYYGKDLLLIGVLNGVFMFFSDLVKYLDMPVKVDFVRLASYGSGAKSSGDVRVLKGIEMSVTGRDVLVVEDIVDTGYTVDVLIKMIKAKNANSIKVCALIDKAERRMVDVPIDYTGFAVEKGFVVGYGLDYDEQFRYFQEIYTLHETGV
ncbi:MAG: hypoxanthine phosphoribosyltransferase [Deltaproteobacteria bacterium]|nr:hypoxanthine phosphoribosyltransferase [Deltaproteobacteria bacterium]